MYEITYNRKPLEGTSADAYPLPITSSAAAYKYLMKYCYKPSDMWREKAFALYLDKKKNVLGHILISVGSFDSTTIDKKLIIKGALDVAAHGVILSHNHPQADARPSINDINNTAELRNACRACQLEFTDHIVIAEKEYFSFSEEKTTPVTDSVKPTALDDAIEALMSVYPKVDKAATYAGFNPRKVNPEKKKAIFEIQRLINTLRV